MKYGIPKVCYFVEDSERKDAGMIIATCIWMFETYGAIIGDCGHRIDRHAGVHMEQADDDSFQVMCKVCGEEDNGDTQGKVLTS